MSSVSGGSSKSLWVETSETSVGGVELRDRRDADDCDDTGVLDAASRDVDARWAMSENYKDTKVFALEGPPSLHSTQNVTTGIFPLGVLKIGMAHPGVGHVWFVKTCPEALMTLKYKNGPCVHSL